MNRQDAMFEPQPQQVSQTSEQQEALASLPREQQYWHAAQIDPYATPYEEGYHGGSSHPDPREQLQPGSAPDQQGSRTAHEQARMPFLQGKNKKWLWWSIIVLALLPLIPFLLSLLVVLAAFAALAAAVFYGVRYALRYSSASRRAVVLDPRVFEVAGQTRLELDHRSGTVTIRASDGPHVEIKGIARVKDTPDALEQVTLFTEQKGNIITVFTRFKQWPYNSLDLDILVPANSDLRIKQNAGKLTVAGVSGQFQITTNAGAMHISGGELRGSSSLNANAGSIHFAGSLARAGEYAMSANAGEVNINLPQDSSFTVSSTLIVGAFHNGFGSNTVGQPPYARLKVRTSVGAIKLNPAPSLS